MSIGNFDPNVHYYVRNEKGDWEALAKPVSLDCSTGTITFKTIGHPYIPHSYIASQLGDCAPTEYEMNDVIKNYLEKDKKITEEIKMDAFKNYLKPDERITENFFAPRKPTPMQAVPEIEKVIFNPPATIVFWTDGTKTVVKRWVGQDTEYDPDFGILAAFWKKMHGNGEAPAYYKPVNKAAERYHEEKNKTLEKYSVNAEELSEALHDLSSSLGSYLSAIFKTVSGGTLANHDEEEKTDD